MTKLRDLPILGIDMDDVTADFSKKALRLYNEDNVTNQLKFGDITDWDQSGDLFRKYYHREGFFTDLDVLDGAQEVLGRLSENYEIFFITASPTPHGTLEKKEWVEKHFPFIGFKRVIATPYKFLINIDLLFDDSPKFLPKFGGYRVLKDMPNNQHLKQGDDYEFRVHDWFEFEEVINELKSYHSF